MQLHKIIATKTNSRGRYEIQGRMLGEPGEYHFMVHTHDASGRSLKNEFGGYNHVNVGSPKYIERLWKAIPTK